MVENVRHAPPRAEFYSDPVILRMMDTVNNVVRLVRMAGVQGVETTNGGAIRVEVGQTPQSGWARAYRIGVPHAVVDPQVEEL